MRLREEQKRKTREKLLQTTLVLFEEKGILATKTVDIAKKAGVSHGTLFVHFPTREKLVAAVIGEFAEQVMEMIHQNTKKESSLREILMAHVSSLLPYEAFYARLIIEGPLLPTYARSTLIGIQSAISFHLAEIAKREMKEKKLRSFPFPLLFNTWVGLIHHYVSNRDLFAPNESVLKRYGSELVDHYIKLLSFEKKGERK